VWVSLAASAPTPCTGSGTGSTNACDCGELAADAAAAPGFRSTIPMPLHTPHAYTKPESDHTGHDDNVVSLRLVPNNRKNSHW
jgi:hypothetical protein